MQNGILIFDVKDGAIQMNCFLKWYDFEKKRFEREHLSGEQCPALADAQYLPEQIIALLDYVTRSKGWQLICATTTPNLPFAGYTLYQVFFAIPAA